MKLKFNYHSYFKTITEALFGNVFIAIYKLGKSLQKYYFAKKDEYHSPQLNCIYHLEQIALKYEI